MIFLKQNAYEIYEHMDGLNPYSVDTLLSAIKSSLIEAINMSDEPTGQAGQRWKLVTAHLQDHNTRMYVAC